MRTCIGCRKRATKEDLVRIVRGADGSPRLDTAGRAPGRGAYVCSDVGCLEQAVRYRRLAGALRTPSGRDGADHARRVLEEFARWQR